MHNTDFRQHIWFYICLTQHTHYAEDRASTRFPASICQVKPGLLPPCPLGPCQRGHIAWPHCPLRCWVSVRWICSLNCLARGAQEHWQQHKGEERGGSRRRLRRGHRADNMGEGSGDLGLTALCGLSAVRWHLVWARDSIVQTVLGLFQNRACQVRGNHWNKFPSTVSTSAAPELCFMWLQLLFLVLGVLLNPWVHMENALAFCLPSTILKNNSALTGQYGRKDLFLGTGKRQVKTCIPTALFCLVHE